MLHSKKVRCFFFVCFLVFFFSFSDVFVVYVLNVEVNLIIFLFLEFLLYCSVLRIWCCLCGNADLIPGLLQWVKDPVLPQLWHRLQLHLGFYLRPGNFHMPDRRPKKKKKNLLFLIENILSRAVSVSLSLLSHKLFIIKFASHESDTTKY